VHSPSDGAVEEQASGAAPADASALEFSLVDFGSSVDAAAWVGDGMGSWQVENPTGDARYWGPASWLRFLGGAEALSQDAGLLLQYSRRLDVFALAVCALEVMGKLHTADCPSEASLHVLPQSDSLQASLVLAVQQAHSSWSSYWAMAVTSFDRLAEYSRLVCCGDPQGSALCWQDLSRGNIPQTLQGRLHDLCDDLMALGDICRQHGDACGRGGAGEAWLQVSDTLEALRDMVHEDSSLEWAELSARLGGAPQRWLPGEPPIAEAAEGVDESIAVAAGPCSAAGGIGAGGTHTAAGPPEAAPASPVATVAAGPPQGRPTLEQPAGWLPREATAPGKGCAEACGSELRELDAAEAMELLRQVESEVRTLKSWYAEAIEAMRSPLFPACGDTARAIPPCPAVVALK